VRAAQAPVTADIGAGYGETPDAVMKSVAEIIRAGAVGVNLEDGTPHGGTPIRNIPDAADRIWAAREAARAAAIPIVINAHTDLYLLNPRRRRLRVTPRISQREAAPLPRRTLELAIGARRSPPFGEAGLLTR
jgi:2-methylisocitrate lyase-like PEP mutase family enzyme